MAEKNELHKRNKHNGQYDFSKLILDYPALEKFVALNKYGTLSIDFFNPKAVRALNKALLIGCYGITYWDIPTNYLCPPIPGRADYIHYLFDLLSSSKLTSPTKQVKCLDVGVGANCIYPMIGCTEYGWQFVGTDIDPIALENANKIVRNNSTLSGNIELRMQTKKENIFKEVISLQDFFDVTLCNPPFHSSKEEAERTSLRKLSSLKGKRVTKVSLNFEGNENELWCEGGEVHFLLNMITESRSFSKNVGWFTTLVSKESNLGKLYAKLKSVNVAEYRTITMQQGTKTSRILAWRY